MPLVPPYIESLRPYEAGRTIEYKRVPNWWGADLPVNEVIEAAWQLAPQAVAFSSSDPAIVRASLPALAAVISKLPPRIMAIIGGAGVEPHARALRGYGFQIGLDAFTAVTGR